MLIIGIAMIVIGIFGGGFEIKEIKTKDFSIIKNSLIRRRSSDGYMKRK